MPSMQGAKDEGGDFTLVIACWSKLAPTVNKYIALGLGREAVTLAVGHYGDNPTKVPDLVNGYNLLREMGFPSKSVAEDTDKALAHFLNSSS